MVHISVIYIKSDNNPRMERWGTSVLTLFHEEDCPFNTTLVFHLSKNVSKLLIGYPISHFLVIWI